MKKSIIALHASALLISSLLQAEALAVDNSAQLNITGSVTQGNALPCYVQLDKWVVNLKNNLAMMSYQNEPIQQGEAVMILLGETQPLSTQCFNLASQKKIAYRFIAPPDNADGTVMANSDTTSGAAKGIGIGLYDYNAPSMPP